jgi:hypothetical protein
MKSVYRIGDDLFIAISFVSFVVGVILRLLRIPKIWLDITPRGLLFFSMMCLLFSIALSLYDLNLKK